RAEGSRPGGARVRPALPYRSTGRECRSSVVSRGRRDARVIGLLQTLLVDFRSSYRHGFLRAASCTIRTSIAQPAANAEAVLAAARECHDDGAGLAVFPELTLSGYSIEDVLMQDTLLDAVEEALLEVVAGSADLLPVLVVGAPLRHRHRIHNTAVVI